MVDNQIRVYNIIDRFMKKTVTKFSSHIQVNSQ